jgi:hypothetical protein
VARSIGLLKRLMLDGRASLRTKTAAFMLPLALMAPLVPPNVSEVAPDFTLSDATGTPRRLADLCAERPLLLVFYRGHW